MKQEPPSTDKWIRWIDRLRDEVLTVILYRHTWRTIINAADTNPAVPRTYLFNYLANTYGASQAVAIRRICGEQSQEVSFGNLLREVATNPDLLTPKQVDVAQLEADIRPLDTGNLKKIRKYASQYLAHGHEARPAPVPTFDELHAAVDELGVLVRRYMLLIEDADQRLETGILHDWMAPFRVAWLPPLGQRDEQRKVNPAGPQLDR